MVEYVDRCWFTSGASGSSDFTDGTAESTYRNLSGAGCVNTSVYAYLAVNGSEWEIGTGAYASGGGGTLARTTIVASSTGSKVSFSSAPKVLITLLAGGLAEFMRIGRRHERIMAGDFIPRQTNGMAFGALELATNKNNLEYLAADPTTQEFADYLWFPPPAWDGGTISGKIRWTHPSTTTNFGVVFQMAAVAVGDNESLDAAFGTAQTMTDTGGTTSREYITPECSAVTVAGSPSSAKAVWIRIARVPANGSDNMAVDAYILGLDLFYTENAATD